MRHKANKPKQAAPAERRVPPLREPRAWVDEKGAAMGDGAGNSLVFVPDGDAG
jgi:hypothetical protein